MWRGMTLCPHQVGVDRFLRAAPCPQNGHAGERKICPEEDPTPGALETIGREVLGGSWIGWRLLQGSRSRFWAGLSGLGTEGQEQHVG